MDHEESENTRILIIEEDPDFRELVATHLGDWGYDITAAPNLMASEEILEKNSDYDLILMDIEMNEDSGVGFLKAKERNGLASIPVVIVSSIKEDRLDRATGGTLEYDQYIEKPCTIGDILEVLSGTVEK